MAVVKDEPKRKPARRAKSAPAPVPAVVKPLTAREQAQVEALKARHATRPSRAQTITERYTDGRKNAVTFADDSREELNALLLWDALGSRSQDFLIQSINTLCQVTHSEAAPSDGDFNASLALMSAIAPENELEATIGLQLVAADSAARKCIVGMRRSDMVEHHKMYGDLANKFMRTSAALLDALGRFRRGGEQVVKHVHVHEGGQAVVADTFNNNQRGGGGALGSGEQSHTVAASGSAALPSPDPEGWGVQPARDAERALPHARRN